MPGTKVTFLYNTHFGASPVFNVESVNLGLLCLRLRFRRNDQLAFLKILSCAMSAQKGITGIALLYFNLGASWGWVVDAKPRPLYPRESDW